VNATWLSHAQNEVNSADLTQVLTTFLDSMNAAQTSDQAARSKAARFIQAAGIVAVQIQDTNLSLQCRSRARAETLKLKIKAARTQLEAARRTASLLATARGALGEISHDLGNDTLEDLGDLPPQEEQAKIDAGVGNLNFPGQVSIYPETATAIAAARSYYELACKRRRPRH